ncbi:hypothetical protein Tco_0930762, partial [Tanacetum coccineum]
LEYCYFQNSRQIHAIIDGKAMVISESSVRSDLLFNDEDGIACLTNDEIFENLALMGYEQLSTKLTFQKGSFSPQWKFLIHTILHCISSKSTAWNEFSTNLASAVICLAKGQKFNFSKLIFDGMLRNLDPKRFLMYPRFLQLFLNNQLKDLPEPFNDTYETPTHSKKVFSNMARKSKKNLGKVTPLFDSMLVQNQAPEGEDFVPPTPHDSPLSRGNTPGSDEGRMELIQELMETYTSLTKRVLALEEAKTAQDRVITRLKLRVKRLEKKRKARTPQPIKRRLFKGRVETSTDKSLGEDASKQGRNDDKTEKLNLTDGADTKVIVEDKGSVERGGSTTDQVSTARPEVSAASVPVNVSAATPSTPPTTITIFGDEDLTIAQTLVKMRSEKAKEKERGVVLIDEEEPPRLNRSTTTLQPLPTIDLKDKERQRQEEAINAALAEEFDEIQARIDADSLFAAKLQQEEREKFTIEERA